MAESKHVFSALSPCLKRPQTWWSCTNFAQNSQQPVCLMMGRGNVRECQLDRGTIDAIFGACGRMYGEKKKEDVSGARVVRGRRRRSQATSCVFLDKNTSAFPFFY